MKRRHALGLLGAGFGLAAVSKERIALALGQAGGWYAAASGAKATFPKGAVIRTLVEDLPPEKLGTGATLFHEHINSFAPPKPLGPNDVPPGPVAPRTETEYLDLLVEELKMARADGVHGIVDAATGRRASHEIENLKQLSRRSGVHIIAAGGHYQDLDVRKFPPEIVAIAEDALAEQFVGDAREQRWGAFGEIAFSQPPQEEERKVLRAVAKGHLRTNLPIFTHTPHSGCPPCALEQLEILEKAGVDPRRVCIGHLATIKPDTEPIAQTAKTVAKRGGFVGFDTVGHPTVRSQIPEATKVKYVLALLEAGYEDHLLLSADATVPSLFKANWGLGYGSVVAQFVPKLRYAGVKDATLHKILVDNPRRFLAFVPRSV